MKMLRNQEVVIIKFTFDYNNRYEIPVMTICNPDKRELDILSNLKGLEIIPRFNSVSELKFTAYKKFNDIELNWYNLLQKNRLIHVEGFGYFVIIEVEEVTEYQVPYKNIVAYSAEYLLNYKGINLTFIKASETNSSTYSKNYKFYDPISPQGTLLYELFRSAPAWKIGHVSADLYNQYRTFSPTNQGLYGFLMTEVAPSYEVIFLFDFETFTVGAYTPKEIVKNTDIILTFDNLVKKIQITELSNDVYTVLRVNGAENLSIARINPTGTNKLFKFDYYMNDSWLGKDVYAVDNSGQTRQDATNRKIFLKDYVLNWQKEIKEQMENASQVGTYGYILKSKKKLNRHLLITQAVYKDQETLHNSAQDIFSQYLEDTKTMTASGKTTKYNYFKKIVRACEKNLETLKNGGQLYTIYKDLSDATQNAYFDTESEDIGQPTGDQVYNGQITSDDIPAPYKYYSITSLNNKIGIHNEDGSYPNNTVNKSLSDIVDKYAFDKYFSPTERKILDPFIVETEYQDSSFIVTDEMNIADYSNTDKKVLTTDGIMTIKELMNSSTAVLIDDDYVAQQLLKQGYSVLDKISTPSFSFKLNCSNFLFDINFEHFLHQLEFGSILNIQVSDDEWVFPFLQEMVINYENPKDFSMKFGNRFRLSDDEWTYADLHNETVKVSQTVGSTLPVVAEPVVNGTIGVVEDYMNNALIAANQSIKATKDNEFVFGGFGLRGRKINGKTSTNEPIYDNEQIWINNNLLCFTDDNWNTVKSALGKIEVNGHSAYGLVAEHIVGKLVAGESLTIANRNNSFVVDGSGATLTNATLNITQKNGSSIKINPTTGMSVVNDKGMNTFHVDTNGNVSLTGSVTVTGGDIGEVTTGNLVDGTVGGFVITPNKIHSTNNLVELNSNGSGKLGNMTWDTAGNVVVNNITANGGKFTGTVQANKILTGGIYGMIDGSGLADGTVTMGKLAVDQLDAKYATVDSLNATNVTIKDGLSAANATITEGLSAANARIDSITSSSITTEYLEANYAGLTFVNAMNAELGNTTASVANIANLVAQKANISDLNATNAKINNLRINDLYLNGSKISPVTVKIEQPTWGSTHSFKDVNGISRTLREYKGMSYKSITILRGG